MQLNDLKPKSKNKKGKLIGRGGKRGKTSGRGTKGQRARAGHRIRPEIRDVIKKLPKLRGRGRSSLKSLRKDVYEINLSALDKRFENGAEVSPKTLRAKRVKILGVGEITKKFSVVGCGVSKSARAKIEAAGGTISQ